jgi:hypothetical protein
VTAKADGVVQLDNGQCILGGSPLGLMKFCSKLFRRLPGARDTKLLKATSKQEVESDGAHLFLTQGTTARHRKPPHPPDDECNRTEQEY